jgi:hypothetical protein
MFGTLKPQSCSLDEGGKEGYAQFYCGLCKTLGDSYDTPTRALLSNDAVFLALLADGLIDEGGEASSCRCPMMPVIHRPTIAPSSAGLRYAAGVQMLLADQFLADRAMDGRKLYQGARSLLGGRVTKARGLLAGLGVDLAALDGFERKQAGCEIKGETTAEEAAEPTAAALGLVFVGLVELPGAGFKLRSGASRRTLAALGRAVGRVIYVVDALEDLRKDLLDHAFNPCLRETEGGPAIDPDRVDACIRLLRADLAEMRRAIGALPFRRHRRLVENILIGQLGSQASTAMRSARGWSSAAGQRHLAARRAASLPGRMKEVFLFALAFVWTTILAVPAALGQARPRLPGKAPPKKLFELYDGGAAGSGHGAALDEARDAGLGPLLDGGVKCDGGVDAGLNGLCPDDLDAGAIVDAGFDAGRAHSGGGFGHSGCPCSSACDSFARCLDGLGGCFSSLGKCILAMGDCLQKCDPCKLGDPGKGCDASKCCDCNSCVTQCCEPCKGCDPGSCCKGCDPGSCCKGCDLNGCCKGCDGCGNSCNGCGNGCNGCGNGCNGCNCH